MEMFDFDGFEQVARGDGAEKDAGLALIGRYERVAKLFADREGIVFANVCQVL